MFENVTSSLAATSLVAALRRTQRAPPIRRFARKALTAETDEAFGEPTHHFLHFPPELAEKSTLLSTGLGLGGHYNNTAVGS